MAKTGAKSGLLEEYMAERAANAAQKGGRRSARTDPTGSAVKLLEDEEEDEEVPFEKVVIDIDPEERILEKSFAMRAFPRSLKGKFWKVMQYVAAALIFWVLMKLAMEKKKETWKYLKHNTELDEDESIILCENKGKMGDCLKMCERAKEHEEQKQRWCDIWCINAKTWFPDQMEIFKRLRCNPSVTIWPLPPTTTTTRRADPDIS
mmetsp:Transcript_805/g.2387  ORF Transcript_805/g.2387 Transcript_805/m.2387 type:complete len:206 (-) Transcript_805:50-667(-)